MTCSACRIGDCENCQSESCTCLLAHEDDEQAVRGFKMLMREMTPDERIRVARVVLDDDKRAADERRRNR